ncbi:hypothetical protein [Marinoscillum sp. MHG1-6]|uniref:hypothetical protein n=1 Tax=Marinoscillum sp. MHG1-6 TaxID=2959627 RepID=UPI0021578F5D|nr:hypothetical protein [Marinoscillum sp. MHG1-6]
MRNDRLKPIPREFYSASTGVLFAHCIECDKNLLDGDTEYLIEKAVKNYPGYDAQDTIFDYAICLSCAHQMHSKMSAESLNKIQDYFNENIDFAHKQQLMEQGQAEMMTQTCMIKGTPRDGSSEFQLYAHCKGNQLVMGNPPYMISGEAMEEIIELLSESTKDELGGFFNKHFSPDPDLFENPTPKRLILV